MSAEGPNGETDGRAMRAASARLRLAERDVERMLRSCERCEDTRDMARYSIGARRWLGCPTCERVIPLKGRTA